MKLVRCGAPGAEKPGLIDAQGVVRDLSAHVKDITGDTLSPASLDKLRKIDPKSLPAAPQGARLGAPVTGVRNFIAIGLNYADHAKETGAAIPKEPIIFNKAPSCLQGPDDDIMLPKGSKKTDWEVELAIIVGRGGSYIDEKNAIAHVAGFAVCNDVSEREYQIERGGQWTKGKGCPTFGPIGPWLVTEDEVDTSDLAMTLSVNGELVQNGSSSTMVFKVPFLVHYISQFVILEPGDVITT